MMKKYVLLLLLAVTGVAWGIPASRVQGEDWTIVRDRYLPQGLFDTQNTEAWEEYSRSASSVAKPLEGIDFSSVPDVGNRENVNAIFRYFRDTRFINNANSPKRQRRLSWYYPDDGCYVRAQLMVNFGEMRNWPAPKKVFAFGNLATRTQNHPRGMVFWWYHVAPVYRTGEVVWVIDPAVDFQKPLTIKQWRNAISAQGSGAKKFALCSGQTYGPSQNCSRPGRVNHNSVINSQKSFHAYEWNRVQDLGWDPFKVL